MVPDEKIFTTISGSICHVGSVLPDARIEFSARDGLITYSSAERASQNARSSHRDNATPSLGKSIIIDDNHVIAPGLIELQTSGLCGVHFTTLTQANHEEKLRFVAREMAKNGVTAWYATIPTVPEDRWKEVSDSAAPSLNSAETAICLDPTIAATKVVRRCQWLTFAGSTC